MAIIRLNFSQMFPTETGDRLRVYLIRRDRKMQIGDLLFLRIIWFTWIHQSWASHSIARKKNCVPNSGNGEIGSDKRRGRETGDVKEGELTGWSGVGRLCSSNLPQGSTSWPQLKLNEALARLELQVSYRDITLNIRTWPLCATLSAVHSRNMTLRRQILTMKITVSWYACFFIL